MRDVYEEIVKKDPKIVSKSAAKRIVSLRDGRLPKGLAIVTAEQLREIEWVSHSEEDPVISRTVF